MNELFLPTGLASLVLCQTEHFSTQIACIFKLGYQILEIEIDNPAASSLALWFLDPTGLLTKLFTEVSDQHHIFKVLVGHHFLESCDVEYL